MSKSPSSTSAVVIRLPQFTIPAPWPLPYEPLTEVFTPPSQCNDKWTLMTENTDPKTTSIGQFINLLDTNDATCLPPGYGSDVWSATFSPGIYCPSGYAIAATGTEVHTALWEKDIKHDADERKLVCCLSGFGYTKLGDGDACVSSYDESTTALTQDYETKLNLFVYTKTTEVGPGIAIGRPIHLRHKDDEFKSLFTGVPSDVAGSGDSDSGGLSTGAIAGIAAGCGVVGLAVLGLGIWFLLRHRRKKQGQQQGDRRKSSSEEGSVEMVYSDSRAPPPVAGWAARETAVAPGGHDHGHDHGHGGAEQAWTAKEPAVVESSKRKSSRSKRDRGEHGERERGERSERSRHSRRHAT